MKFIVADAFILHVALTLPYAFDTLFDAAAANSFLMPIVLPTRLYLLKLAWYYVDAPPLII